MKKKTRNGLLVLVLLLAVGFAAVSTSLIINGTAMFGTNEDDFDVIFTKSVIDGVDVSETTISEDGASLTFTTSELAIMNDTSVLDFEVTNNSTQYDASVTMECVVTGEKANTYYKVESDLPEVINAASKENGNVTVTLLRTSVDEIEETFTCTISATATERDTVGEKVELGFVPTYFAFGTPSTASATDYATLGKNVFTGLSADNSIGVCINDNGLFCIKYNDYENTVASMKEHFGEDSCDTSNGTYVQCSSDAFRCGADSDGSVDCSGNIDVHGCSIHNENDIMCG